MIDASKLVHKYSKSAINKHTHLQKHPEKRRLLKIKCIVNIKNEVAGIEPLILYSRVIFLAERDKGMEPTNYEPTNYALLHLKDVMMRSAIKDSVYHGTPNVDLLTNMVQVIGGVPYKRCLYTKFSNICKIWERHLNNDMQHMIRNNV